MLKFTGDRVRESSRSDQKETEMLLTKQQRAALKAVFDRQPLYRHFIGIMGEVFEHLPLNTQMEYKGQRPATYRQFRRTVRIGSGCIMVPWCGMWLGIEPDGHTHS